MMPAFAGVVDDMTRVLGVCGSLQGRSANGSALDVAYGVVRAGSASVDEFERLDEIPAFDATRVDDPIEVVDDWRRRVDEADAILIAAPEYAGGLAGAVKNALDWLVNSGNLYRKPVAVMSAGTSGGAHARAQLVQTLTWQGAYVIAELGISVPRTKSDAHGRFIDPSTIAALSSLADTVLAVTAMPAERIVSLATDVVHSLGVDTGHIAPAA
jgi:NAD(P)H-dependent FMN reductase